MKDLIRKVLREEVIRRFTKGTPEIQSFIIKQAEELLNSSEYKVIDPNNNYGNYEQEWCKNGSIQIGARYFFSSDDSDEERFFGGTLFVNEKFVEFLSNLLQVRKKFILHTLEEWYDEKYSHKFGIEIGNPDIGVDEVAVSDDDWKCKVK
jgi:hypothetical protein